MVFHGPSVLQHKLRLEMNDLFEDIKDGVKLLALLEVLSGQRLVRSSNILLHSFYCLSLKRRERIGIHSK